MEKPSRQVSEFKGGSAMEKPSRQVSEFKDTYGIYKPYSSKMPIESEEFEDTVMHSLYSSGDEDEEELKNATFPREAVVKYIEQVRHSFGFDVDVTLPYWAEDLRAYFPYDLSDTSNRARANTAAKLAIDEINADMNGKSYELVEIVKVVSTEGFRLKLLTLTAKKVGEDAVVTIQAIVKCYIGGGLELDQWRFKPDAPAADDA